MITKEDFEKAIDALKQLKFKFSEEEYEYDVYISAESVYDDLSTYYQKYINNFWSQDAYFKNELYRSIKEILDPIHCKGNREQEYEFIKSKVSSVLNNFQRIADETKNNPVFNLS